MTTHGAIVTGPALPVAAVGSHEDKCGNCFYCRGDKGQRQCRRHPPQIMFAPIVRETIAGAAPRVEWITNAAYPPVAETCPACGEFEAQPEIAN